MPGASCILGFLGRQLDVRQLDNHLESSLAIFLAEVDLVVEGVRVKFSWFWSVDGLTPLPFPSVSRRTRHHPLHPRPLPLAWVLDKSSYSASWYSMR